MLGTVYIYGLGSQMVEMDGSLMMIRQFGSGIISIHTRYRVQGRPFDLDNLRLNSWQPQ